MITKIGLYKDPRKKRPWVVRWYGLSDFTTGKKKRYSKSFECKADAERFQAKQLMTFDGGQPRDKSEEKMLRDLCSCWLTVKKRRPSTIKDYRWTIGRLIDHFGPERLLRQITPQGADLFLAAQKPVEKERLSEWTRAKILRNCKAMFNKAVKWDWIVKNPFEDVERPNLILRDWYYVTPNEYQRLLEAAPSIRWKACYALAYTAGLRFSELFNLTWDDVDLHAGEVRIRNRKGTPELPPFTVKTRKAVRTIPLSNHTCEILASLTHRVAVLRVPFVLPSKRQFEGVIVKWKQCQSEKKVWDIENIVNNVPREFNRHLRKAGIKSDEGKTLTLHTLRKCAGKNWADNIDNPRTVQDLMGHASLQTTMQFYNQVSKSDRKKAADVVDGLLKKSDAGLTPKAKSA